MSAAIRVSPTHLVRALVTKCTTSGAHLVPLAFVIELPTPIVKEQQASKRLSHGHSMHWPSRWHQPQAKGRHSPCPPKTRNSPPNSMAKHSSPRNGPTCSR